VEFRILGPLQVWNDDRRVSLGGPQVEKLLAALLLADGAIVPLDSLIDALWDGEPPPTAKHQVHKLVANLRRRLPGSIETDGPGYRLRLGDASYDAATFVERAAVATIPSLTAALALWRGPALAGLESRALQTSATALNERRLAVTEALIDLRLADGQASDVAAELSTLVAAYPLRESLRARLMVALYRCGRQADALAVYGDTRALLADEIGLDPSPELVRVQQQVLCADPALDRPVPKAPCTLPYDLPDFLGRDAALDQLLSGAGTVVINAIDGMAGIGKTALVVHAAHRLAGGYPDGQLFCDLHAHTPGSQPVQPEAALELLLCTLGVPPDQIPDGLPARTAMWRSQLAGRRVLVVLDNAATAAQVRPLLPGTPHCLTLVTSRRRLGVLDGATVLSLDTLDDHEALALFAAVAGAARTSAEPGAAAEAVRLCGNLPLAIRVAATRLAHRPTWTVRSLVQRLRAQTNRLGELELHDRGVASAFALSVADLADAERRMFRLLGLHPAATFDAYSAAALAETTPGEAESLLESLVDAHLLTQPAGGRYSFHDLLREYARQLAVGEGDAPTVRLREYYLAAATVAADQITREARRFTPVTAEQPRHLPPLDDLDAALTWFAAEHAALLAVDEAGGDWQLAGVLRAYFEHRGHFADWRTTHERALRRAEGDPLGTTAIRFNLGALALWTGRLAEGMQHFRYALHSIDDHLLEAIALTSLGMLAHLRHMDLEAAAYLRRALAIDHDDARTAAMGWNNLGLVEGRLGRPETALEHHRRALAIARRIDSPTAERSILLGLGETSLRAGLSAAQPFRQARELARAGRFRMQEALALDGLAHATGDRECWVQALAIFSDLGVSHAELVRRHLDNPGEVCCELCRASAPVDGARHMLVSA
jgi:DNA-binding SARP family transcriptional activator/tetratricopeptide (TPR) repeat protein